LSATAVSAPPRTERAPRLGVIFTGLMLVMFLAALDSTIVATALPTIVGDLGGLTKLSWVTSAYLLAQTAVTPLYGKLGDLLGRKRVLQSAVLLFLAGSALCGLSRSMTELIAFRAVQGLGAGGLIVLVQATVGDVVSPRERGRYQGLFGAVFGVSSVAGPLLGGLLVEHVSWRAIFYVNLPVGLIALFVLGATLPTVGRITRPVIDYLGAATLAAAVSAIVLVASLGGTTWPWGSPQVVVVAALGALLLGVFLLVERRASEPVLPFAVMRDAVFRVAFSLSMVVGFALFGAVTFLPLFFQTVYEASPTGSGLRLIPLMGGLVFTSILSGRLISRFGRYKVFPVFGTAIMAVGLLLLSTLHVGTAAVAVDGYLLVLGLGLGLVMQVLVLAVQNAVDFSVLGAATSGVTLSRGIGGSLGTAVFGTIFSTGLISALHGLLGTAGATRSAGVAHGTLGAAGAQLAHGARLSGAQVAELPAAARSAYQHAYVQALHPVFLVAAGVAAGGFLLSLCLRERPLRASAVASQGLERTLAVPCDGDSLAEIDRALSLLVGRERRRLFNVHVAERAGVDLSSGAVWALSRFATLGIPVTRELAQEMGIEATRIAEVEGELRERGLIRTGERHRMGEGEGLSLEDDEELPSGDGERLTPAGVAAADQILSARRDELYALLADHGGQREPQVTALLQRIAVELAGERP
jgi:EmrB/QacA subfamily drug resistance transporter